ncbi:NSFL1 cofactor p47 [Rhipicephalus microplus]|uniref:NSFL1 cofactor p47 n=1 Tax=Rhipicephalus microplus TaxID=6941 RepID=UPI002376AF10
MDPSSSKQPSPDKPKKLQHVTIADPPKPETKSSVRIRGFSDLARRFKNSADEGQAFYAGGSENSGQQIIAPGKKTDNKEDFVAEMFRAARLHGAATMEPGADDKTGKAAGAVGSSFSGAGRKLDDAAKTGETVAPVDRTAPQCSISKVLKMWENGFSVDDGPLRAYDSPSSEQFLQSIRQGEVPVEMLQEAEGAEVDLIMEDHRHEQFFAPQRIKVMPFEGTGHRLGAVTPTMIRRTVTMLPIELAEANAKKAINLNEALPTTNIQIRLHDGSRLVARMNQTNTVADIRKYIVNARPEYEAATFTLQTMFPRKELTNDQATLKEANLLNVVIVQRLK